MNAHISMAIISVAAMTRSAVCFRSTVRLGRVTCVKHACQHMQLKVTVERPITAIFQRRVQVSAFCEKVNQAVSEPQIGCGKCHDLPFKFEIKE